MRLVVHGNARRKFDPWREIVAALTLRLFDQRKEIEAVILERALQSLFDHLEGTRVGDSVCFRIAHAKNAQHDIVSPGKNIRAQDVDRHDRK
jgi:hypothetical protein